VNHHTRTVLAFATASLGLLVGWLTGMSGLDPGVVAAVVPVVVTASGMAIYYGTRTEPDPIPQVMAGYAILFFSRPSCWESQEHFFFGTRARKLPLPDEHGIWRSVHWKNTTSMPGVKSLVFLAFRAIISANGSRARKQDT